MVQKKRPARKPPKRPARAAPRPKPRARTAAQILAREQERRLRELERERDRAQRRIKSAQARVQAASRARTIAARERELRALKHRAEVIRARTRKLKAKQKRERELLRAQLRALRELEKAGRYKPKKKIAARDPRSIRRTLKRLEASTFVPERPSRGTIQRQKLRSLREATRWLMSLQSYAADHPGEVWGVRLGARIDGTIRLSDIVAPEDLSPQLIKSIVEDITDPNARVTDHEEDEEEEEDKLWAEVVWSPRD